MYTVRQAANELRAGSQGMHAGIKKQTNLKRDRLALERKVLAIKLAQKHK